jgi:hypothetical protein
VVRLRRLRQSAATATEPGASGHNRQTSLRDCRVPDNHRNVSGLCVANPLVAGSSPTFKSPLRAGFTQVSRRKVEGERVGERSQSKVGRRRWWPRTRLGVVVVLGLIACAMVTSIVLYVNGAASQSVLAHGRPDSSGTTVTLNLVNVQNSYTELVGDLAVKPGPGLVDEATYALKDDLTVAVTSVTTPVRRTWSKGMLPGVFPVPLTLARDVERWPFDSYHTGPITVTLFVGPSQTPERANVTSDDLLGGWKVHVTRVNAANESSPYVLELRRSEHDGFRAGHPVHLRRDRGSWLVRCDSDVSRSSNVSGALNNLVRRNVVCGGTAEKRASEFAGVRKLDRSHDRFVGTGGSRGRDAALYRGLVASVIQESSRTTRGNPSAMDIRCESGID